MSFLNGVFTFLVPARRRPVLATLLLLPLCLLAEEGPEDLLAPVAPLTLQALDGETIKAKVKELESLTVPGPGEKAALEHYQSTLLKLKEAETDDAEAGRFRRAIDSAAERQAEVKSALEQITRALQSPDSLADDLSLANLEQQLDQAQADRGVVQGKLSELETTLARERLLPDQVIEQVAKTKLKILELQAQLRDLKAGEGLSVQEEALSISLQASLQALKSRLNRLELERLSHAPRMDLLNGQIEVGKLKFEQIDRRVLKLQELLNEKRSAEAAQALETATEVKREASGKHPVIRAAAEQNAVLSKRLGTLASTLEQATTEKEELNSRLKSLEQELEQSRQRLDIVGFDEVLGKLLRTQRKGLPDIKRLKKHAADVQNYIAEARLEQFRIEDERQRLLREGLLPSLTEGDTRALDPAQEMALRIESEQLLEGRLELLQSLGAAYGRYEKVLGDLELTQRQMIAKVALYRELLDSNLVWMPNAAPIGLDIIPAVAVGLDKLFSAETWDDPVQELLNSVAQYPVRTTVLAMAVLLMLSGRRRMRQRLAEMAPRVGNVQQDSFMLTVEALLITLLLALPWVLLLLTIAWLLMAGPDPNVDAVAEALLRTTRYLLLLQVVRYLLIPNGLAQVHFSWSKRTVKLLRPNLRWLLLVSLPLFTVGAFAEYSTDPYYRDNLGRVCSVLGVLVIAWFAHRVLNPWSGVMVRRTSRWSLHYLWYPLALILCLALVVFTFEGYQYTSVRLLTLALFTAYAGVVLLLFYHLAERGLLVAERRLALTRARARRQAMLESRAAKEAAEAAGESVLDQPELEEIELDTINEQTRRMLRFAVLLLSGAAVYLIWSQLLPALGHLDQWVLWEYSHEVAGKQELVPVSASALALALMVILFTLVAGRNLPGLMEISILEPLSVEPGSRYAITKVSRYLIYTTGVLVTISMIGVRWGDVQWLVAAMGVGLGFGLQEIFANFISGLMILFERPIRIGDTVTVGEISGTVSRIRIRATTITDFDNKELVVPNKSFVTDPLINWTLSDPVTRIVIDLGIAYGSDTEQAHAIMTKVVTDHPEVLDDPNPTVFFIGFGESSLDFQIRVFVSERIKRMPLKHDLHMALDKELREAGIEIPFPQRDLHLRSVDPDVTLRGGGSAGADSD